LEEIGLAVVFLTRLPWPFALGAERPLTAAAWAFPLAGALIGAVGALAFGAADALGLPPVAAALIAVAATALATGALHEDGLADVVDGFGGGRDAESKRRIMRDSRIGSYGVLALIVATGLKIACLASLGPDAAAALVAAHALGRGVLPGLARALPFAAEDGLARLAGRPGRPGALWSAGLAGVLALGLLPGGIGLAAAVAAVAAAIGVGALARRQIGGVTGDVLGAAEQMAEITVLLTITAYLGP
jgi:adenosylcobinamide-GDP ribazoletransferase